MSLTPRPLVSPIQWRFDDYKNRAVVVSFDFDETTHALFGITAVREPGCLYDTLFWGLGPDGTPNTSPKQFKIPFGQTDLQPNQLARVGLRTIEDVTDAQFTVGVG
jgi:hypothetical protein